MKYLFYLASTFFFFLSNTESLSAQEFSPLSIEGIVNGQSVENSFAGGLNSPQFNSIDLNNDGQLDLLVFDRAGNVLLPFMMKEGIWKYSPQYLSAFPEVKEWVLLRDYNMDGMVDLFAYSDVPGIDGILVYQGYYQNDTIAFERIIFPQPFNIIFFELPNGGDTNLRVTKIDYPAIDDMDCDGDLDILTFNVGGGQIELFQNLSVENGYGTDSLIFKLVEFCWGGIFETGFTKEVELVNTPGGCATPNSPNIEFRHAGSTLLTMDMDNDGDKDLILGDLSFDNLNFLKNGGNCSQAWMEEQDVNFPSNSVPVEVFSYPSAFSLDVDNDGIKDLIAAPNLARGGENAKVSWVYKNTGTNDLPVFEFQQDDFLVENMFDLGGQSHPVFVDVDNDGLLDMIVGNGGFFDDFQVTRSGLYLFKNVGDENSPAFELIDSNYLNLNQFNPLSFNFSPDFGDLDGDGDLDLVVGEESGSLFYAENVAGPNAPMQFASWQYPYQSINVGLSSTPQIFDLNQDGLLDLIIGEKNGNINFFPNQGEKNKPVFESDPSVAPNNFFLGEVDTRQPGFIIGSSQATFFYQAGEIWLATGTENSGVEVYKVVDNQVDMNFALSEIGDEIPNVGFKTSIALADLNNDGLLEMALGNERGGLSFFTTPWINSQLTSSKERILNSNLKIYPNPASDFLRLDLPEDFQDKDVVIRVFNLNGQKLLEKESTNNPVDLDISSFLQGLYFVEVSSNTKVITKKWIKR